MIRFRSAMTLAGAFAGWSCSTEQRVDLSADVAVASPHFPRGQGPRVLIDGGHGNLHTESGTFAPFAQLLRNDGMNVAGSDSPVTPALLEQVDVLVIANAGSESGGSAFSAAEIAAIRAFVERGGGLLLIADHSPYPAAVAELGRAFGVTLHNVFADHDEDEIFTTRNGGIGRDPLLAGIGAVRTFGGSTLETSDPKARQLLRLWPGWTIQTMQGEGLSPEQPAGNALQAVALERGSGRVAVFGEAAMFTAQRAEGLFGEKIGFHAKGAEGNKALILRLMNWLAGPAPRAQTGIAAAPRRP